MNTTIGFIGGGRITAIFLEAWQRANLKPASILVSDPDLGVLEKLKVRFSFIETTTDNARTLKQDLIFLGLHPPVMKTVLAGLVPRVETTIISLAPVLNFSKLSEWLKGHARLVRMIPNAPSILGRGYNPVAFGPGVSPQDRARIHPFFAALGESPEIPEVQIEAHAILTAMGPTYFWPQWQQLRTLGLEFGLDAAAVDKGLKAMLRGAVDQLFESGLPYEVVYDTIPGKPLAESQESILAHYREKLPALHARLTGGA